MDIHVPTATFSACFGAPFLVWHPLRYAELLKKKVREHDTTIWMLNTGWVCGPYGKGHRIALHDTRCISNAIHDGSLAKVSTRMLPHFQVAMPLQCPALADPEFLWPRAMWQDKTAYDVAGQNRI